MIKRRGSAKIGIGERKTKIKSVGVGCIVDKLSGVDVEAEDGMRDFCLSRGFGDVFFRAVDGIRYSCLSRELGDVYSVHFQCVSFPCVSFQCVSFPCCLLYPVDVPDDLLCWAFGARRLIKTYYTTLDLQHFASHLPPLIPYHITTLSPLSTRSTLSTISLSLFPLFSILWSYLFTI